MLQYYLYFTNVTNRQRTAIIYRNGTLFDRNPSKKDRVCGLSVSSDASDAGNDAKNDGKRPSVLSVFELKILDPDGISLFESEALEQLYASLLHDVIIQISHGSAVVEIGRIEYL